MPELTLNEGSTDRVVKQADLDILLKYIFYGSTCSPAQGSRGKEI